MIPKQNKTEMSLGVRNIWTTVRIWTTVGDIEVLLLRLHSGIIPDSVIRGPYGLPVSESGSISHRQAPYLLSLPLDLESFGLNLCSHCLWKILSQNIYKVIAIFFPISSFVNM